MVMPGFVFPKCIMDLKKPETSKNGQLWILHHDLKELKTISAASKMKAIIQEQS